MNLALSREIYGLNPWCMDQISFPALMSILDGVRNGVSLEAPDEKYNRVQLFNATTNETKLVTNHWQLKRTEGDFHGIGLINLDGVITVSGGQSSYGVDYLSMQMKAMSKDDRIKAFIIRGNSGGGSTMAVEIMTNTISEINKTKPVYGSIKEGGMMASACFGIMSACRSINAESEMSIVGSAGTMIQFEGREANSKKDGVKYIRLYAPESDSKNKGFEEALNNDNYKILVDEVLKPINDRFLSLIESNRPQLKGTSFRNGHTTFAKDAIGTFIDTIGSFESIISLAVSGEKNKYKKESININNNNKMTKAEILAAHPIVYAEIVNEGVAQERDRVGAWLSHNETDPKGVREGIESAAMITATQREGFFVKQNSLGQLVKIKTDSAAPLVTTESKTEAETTKTAEQIALEESFNFKLN